MNFGEWINTVQILTRIKNIKKHIELKNKKNKLENTLEEIKNRLDNT